MGATSSAGGNGRTRGTGRLRRTAAMVVLVALLALLAAPGVTAQEQQPAGKLTFTVGMANDIDSMNPFLGYLAEAYEVWGTIYDQLTGYAQKDFAPTPSLAESWTTSEDGKTWTYKIR